MELVISEHIEIIPGICGGKPHIAGHRIKVQSIVSGMNGWDFPQMR